MSSSKKNQKHHKRIIKYNSFAWETNQSLTQNVKPAMTGHLFTLVLFQTTKADILKNFGNQKLRHFPKYDVLQKKESHTGLEQHEGE